MRTLLLTAVAVLAIASPLAAQNLPSRGSARPLRLDPPSHSANWWTIEQGLPGQFVRNIDQSDDGRLWVTAGGVLARFDGLEFEVIAPPLLGDSLSGAAGAIDFLKVGAGDTLWARTRAGVQLARAGGIWMAVPDGFEALIRRGIPHTVETARDLMGSRWELDLIHRAATEVGVDNPRSLEVVTGRFVYSDMMGVLGVRRRGGRLEVICPAGEVWASIPGAPGRTPVLLARDGRLVVAAPGALEVYLPGQSEPETIPFPDVRILSTFEDREGDLWIGTDVKGLLRLQRRTFQQFVLSLENGSGEVRTIEPASDGDLLIVAPQALFRVRDNQVETLRVPGFDGNVFYHAALEDPSGTLWVSLNYTPFVEDQGTLVALGGDGRMVTWETNAAVLDLAISPDDQEMAWLDAATRCRIRLPARAGDLPDCRRVGPRANRLLWGRDGTLWITEPGRVRAEPPNGVERIYGAETGYRIPEPRALFEDERGALWIGTYMGGLARLRGDSLQFLTRHDGLAEDVVSEILMADDGTFWMEGNLGVHSVSWREANAVLDGSLDRVSARHLTQRDGLFNPEGSGRGGARDGNGRLWFPTFGGAVAVNGRSGTWAGVRPGRLTFDAAQAGGQPIPVGDTLVVPEGRRRLELGITAVSLRAPESIRVESRLEGHGDQWTPLSSPHGVLLERLRPGRWQFEVRRRALPGEAGPAVRAVTLVIPPRMHETVWFNVLIAALLVGLVGAGVSIRTRAAESYAIELETEVERRTAALEAERNRTLKALDEARSRGEQLRDLVRSKSRVFAGLSHELRTPMTLVLGPLRELERESSGGLSPMAREHLGRLRSAVRRLENLTGQFLDLADTQSGSVRLSRQPVDIGTFVKDCLAELKPIAAARNVRLLLELPEDAPIRASIDPDQMDKVVVNLVSNAIKYSPPESDVTVRLAPLDEDAARYLTLEVADRGPGIPRELRSRIFEPFFQLAGATEGMGLGLSIARDVVVLHGGRIEVADTPGGGTTFRVTLERIVPAGTVPAVTAPVVSPDVPAADEMPAPDGSVPQNRILLVEDDPALRSFLTEELGRSYEVHSASDGAEALAVLAQGSVDLVLSDVVMKSIDGLALTRILKADPATRNVPVVLVTARGSREDRLHGLGAGADAYVVKPFDLDELRLKIENLIGLRRNIEERFRQSIPAWSSILLRTGAERLDQPTEQFLERFYRLIAQRIGDPDLDIDQMARALFVSRSSLYRKVRELLDTSPLDLVMEVRLEQAALLLRTEDGTVASICRRVGFRSPAHFSRRFTAHFGVGPSRYRELYGRDPGLGDPVD